MSRHAFYLIRFIANTSTIFALKNTLLMFNKLQIFYTNCYIVTLK